MKSSYGRLSLPIRLSVHDVRQRITCKRTTCVSYSNDSTRTTTRST